ncbi:cupin domain-containing protein [Ramlibacter rhizophilus]|uniref:Cupin domain-containing protein n=1 Tax=Ramlibacter rhizophilus TaxID=1781167 RepID=A0A4Z0BDR0_9BURK|nr:cupin domain-containing protein [Ramlibacter rhizophilus]TFY97455.1 cupin domain-containing protein [Ramlibacter rhizophilus]
MDGFRVTRFDEAPLVTYGPQSDLRVLVGDDDKSTPIRAALQTCQPGYDVPFHSHPYIEYLIVLEGSAVFRIEGEEMRTVELGKGDTVELHAGVWHAFTTSPSEVTRLLGVHISAERIVNYKPGVKTDARGFRVEV